MHTRSASRHNVVALGMSPAATAPSAAETTSRARRIRLRNDSTDGLGAIGNILHCRDVRQGRQSAKALTADFLD